ncbi:MAG TPA: DUF5009 domain-containing protein, partial [Oleiagrimonas sp.]|nr:DUF5009 domain-containing protein [Oleiagrimonas sp.]
HVFWPLDHAEWNGTTPTDFIFPMFLFVMGVSIALAILPRLEAGKATSVLRNAALWRAVRIVALGLAINVLAAWLLPGRDMRWCGVLQRIGICFAIAGMLAIYVRQRTWWIVIGALLAGYALILWFGGPLDKWVNIDDRVDTWVFGHYVWDFNSATGQGHDPEGLLSTLGALATSLLGLCAGVWLRKRRIRTLLIAAVTCIIAGYAWSFWIPLNKNLWTSSFVLWTAGFSALVLAAFHWMMDVRQWPPIGRRFGVNAITAYAGAEAMEVLLPATGLQAMLYTPLSAAITPWAGPYVASLTFAVLFVVLWWIIVWVMDRNRWYLKI